MTPVRALNVAGLPPYNISNQAPLWWGQVILCAIEGSMFCMLIAIYFYLRLGVDVWPPPGARLPDATIATWALVPLFLSTIGSYLASEAAKKNSRGGMIFGLGQNLLFALVFLFLRYLDWRDLNFNWAADAHGSVVWSILFLHTFDVVGDLLMTAVLLIIVIAGRSGPKQRLGVHVDSVVWYFLVAIWLPLYGVIVWAPRIIGTSQ